MNKISEEAIEIARTRVSSEKKIKQLYTRCTQCGTRYTSSHIDNICERCAEDEFDRKDFRHLNVLNLDELVKLCNSNTETPANRLIKAAEEMGELNAAHLKRNGIKNASASSQDNILEEGIDVIQCVIDYLISNGFVVSDIQKMLDAKNKKFRAKLEDRIFE